MSRLVLILVAVLILIAGALALLASRAHERPTSRVEKVVPLANLQ